jgi:small subunit ribosomal protein S9
MSTPATTKTSTKKTSTKDYIYAVGRRKRAIARTRLHEKGTGVITINDLAIDKYFKTKEQVLTVSEALEITSKAKTFDITIKVLGGGHVGQADACRHGIARALIAYDPDLRPVLKGHGLLTRDSREKERKKPGLKKARRGPQWAKR